MAEDERDDEGTGGAEQAEEAAGAAESNGTGAGLRSALLRKEVLIPVAATAATAVAGLAAKKGPDVAQRVMSSVKEKAEDSTDGVVSKLGEEGQKRVKDTLQDAGESGGITGAMAKVASKAVGGGGGGNKKKTRRLPIQRWTDVAVPVERAYELWTNFEEFPRFMHRVVDVEQSDEGKVKWQEKIWFSKRQWEGEITDQRENDRIAWRTTSGTMHTGVVSFHRIDDQLTRVMVTLDFQPAGMLEKMASGLRFAKRAVQADLARFKAYAEMEETEGLEYSARGAENIGESEDEGGDDDEPRASAEDNGGDEESDEERERKRQERLERREQRREHATA